MSWYPLRTVTENPSDAELVRQVMAAGCVVREAETTLCQRFAPRIRLYGIRHLKDEERARDLVQSVLVVLIEAARAGRIEDPERTDRFVLGTCRNVASRMRERERRDESAVTVSFEAAHRQSEVVAFSRLVHCFQSLEHRAKQILTLSFVEERKAGEIAEALAMTAGNVRVVRHRALSALRRCLDLGAEGDA